MEKLKLSSGKELNLIVCGILADSKTVTIKFLPGEEDSLDSLNTLLMDAAETRKMTLLSESGEALSIYNGYTRLQSIAQELEAVIGYEQDEEQQPVMGRLVTATLGKIDQMEARMEAMEQQMTDTQLALCEIYEGRM